MKLPKPVTIDFETDGILPRPKYPPKPVGVSIKYWGKKARYYAWGHHNGKNNCTREDALHALAAAMLEGQHPEKGYLFQNAKFDVDVLETFFPELAKLEWDEIHDTLFLLYLHNPHAPTFALKPSAESILGIKPEEQDAVRDWLVTNQDAVPAEVLAQYGDKKITGKNFGAYIAYCPPEIVGKYANGDVDRTHDLFKHLYESVCIERNMLRAYDRERELMPILLAMERQGVPVDLKRLRADVTKYDELQEQIQVYLGKTLKVDTSEVNLGSGDQLAKALIESGKATAEGLGITKSGKVQTNKKALQNGCSDKSLMAVLTYTSQLATCLGTFMKPWLNIAEQSGGLIFTNWNQTKSTDSDKGLIGTKTGRLSSSPNFQNIPKEFKPLFKHQTTDKKLKKELPAAPAALKDLPDLPLVRGYVVPFKGEVLIDRDYSQQEPRILAHFDGGTLMQRYNENPWIDFHDFAKAELELMGLFYPRRPIKDINLGLIYGMGVPKLAAKTGLPIEETDVLKKAVLSLYPGLKEMYKEMKRRAAAKKPVRTWGGREYYCEPPRLVDGRMRHFDYKLVNVLIQGSAGDCTKEAIIRYWKVKPANHKLILQVHDQLVASVPKKDLKSGMELLRSTMESIEFDVPMLSEGDWSDTNWAGTSMKPFDEKGKKVI